MWESRVQIFPLSRVRDVTTIACKQGLQLWRAKRPAREPANELRLSSRAALAWLLATPRVESLLAGHVTSETRPCCCWVLFGKRLLKLTFSFYQSSCLTKSFPGFQWDIFFLAWREIYRSAAGWDIFCQRLQPWETNRGHHERLDSSKWKVFAWYLG